MYNQITIALLLSCLAVVCCDLKFNANGRFKIVQLTDMHIGELDSNDVNTRKIQKIVIETEKPDLIVVSGDAVSGYAYPNNNTCMHVRFIDILTRIGREVLQNVGNTMYKLIWMLKYHGTLTSSN